MLTFAACELLTFAVSPTSSKAYWTKAVFKPGRAGDLSIVDNQNLWAVLDRFTHGRPPRIGHASAARRSLRPPDSGLAAQAHRRSSPLLGVLICAATCLIVSPISWVHHMVWVVPAILWLALRARPASLGTLARRRDSHSLLERSRVVGSRTRTPRICTSTCSNSSPGNSFFLAMVLFLAGAAVLVVRRRVASPQDESHLLGLQG